MTGIQLPANQIWTGVDFGENVKVRADAQAFILDARLFGHWAIDYDTTDEGVDTLGYRGGVIISAAGAISIGADGTVLLTDNATNYVERTLAGVVSANTSGFTTGRLPMFIVVVASHVFTAITDVRSFGAQVAATLLAIQQLTGAADKGVYFTSASAAALFDLSSFTRTLTGGVDAAAWRTALSAVSQAELAAAVAGFDWKDNVRAKTTANVDLAGGGLANGTTHDGVVVATGDRMLVGSQTAPEENGIYIVPAAGAASRATDNDSWAEMVAAFVSVSEGTVNADTLWLQTANAGGTLGVTAVTWSQFAPPGGGEANTASNVGGQVEVFKQKSGVDLEFRTIVGAGGIAVSQVGDTVEIDGSGVGGGGGSAGGLSVPFHFGMI